MPRRIDFAPYTVRYGMLSDRPLIEFRRHFCCIRRITNRAIRRLPARKIAGKASYFFIRPLKVKPYTGEVLLLQLGSNTPPDNFLKEKVDTESWDSAGL